MKTPVLETERLILRPLTIDDAEVIFASWATDPAVAHFMRWNLHESIEVTKEWLTAEEEAVMSDDTYNWGFVIRDSMKLIGCGGLIFSREHQMFEIGYNLNQNDWGMGFAAEASRRIVDYAKEELSIRHLFATHAVDNIDSGRVLEKLGFQYQNQGTYSKFDGSKTFLSKEYRMDLL